MNFLIEYQTKYPPLTTRSITEEKNCVKNAFKKLNAFNLTLSLLNQSNVVVKWLSLGFDLK